MEKQFPKNVRQIGNVSDQPKIYMEDYVNTYLNQLKETAMETAVGALLVGEIVKIGKKDVVYISGALKLQEIEINGTEIIVSEEVWTELEEQKKEYFREKEVVGWCLVECGHPMGLNRGVVKVHERIFSRENTVGGHYIYYEKNPDMQNYMISMRKMIGVTPSEMVEDRAAKDFRSVIKGKVEYQQKRENSHFLYAMSVFLVVLVLAIGISTMNNYDKMESMQKSVEALSQAIGQPKVIAGSEAEPANEQTNEQHEFQEVEQKVEEAEEFTGTVPEVSTIQEQLNEENYYEVQKGDTLDSISLTKYGTTSKVDDICRMNGLTDGNLIFIGQKLLLP